MLDHRCRACGRVFNVFTGTALAGTHRRPSELVLILRGISKGETTAGLAEELGCSRSHLHGLRQRLQANAADVLPHADPAPLAGDAAVEADEACIAAGEKSVPHPDPDDPPRRRGNQVKGHGTFDKDRPPVPGVVGRDTGDLRLEVVRNSTKGDLVPRVLACAVAGTTVYTDEWKAYGPPAGHGLPHSTVCHNPRRPGGPAFARDDDGDGVREVHCNTLEGIWTGPRNFLRPFRGVSKWYLDHYVAMFEWAYNLKAATGEFLRAMLRRPRASTRLGT